MTMLQDIGIRKENLSSPRSGKVSDVPEKDIEE